MNGYWILWNSFSVSPEVTMWFLSFIVLIWCIALIDIWMLNQTCINSTWQWHKILFICCWIQFVKILRNFASIFMRDVGLWFWFPEITLSDFYIRVILDSRNAFGSVSLSSGFSVCKELELFLFAHLVEIISESIWARLYGKILNY